MKYYLGHTPIVTEGGDTWCYLPTGAAGMVDLRVRGDNGGLVFFTTKDDVTPDGDWMSLGQGHLSEITEGKAAFGSSLGIVGLEGDTLLDWLWAALTVHADPTGEDHVAPLMPTSKGQLDLHLGGHSLIARKRFQIDMPEAAPIIARKQTEYRAARERARRGKDEFLHRRVLDFWAIKYGIDNPEDVFIPGDLPKERRLPHNTTVSDNFNRANGAIGGNWTVYDGTASIVSNTLRNTSSGNQMETAYTASDLDTDDMYSQLALTLSGGGTGRVATRMISDQFYYFAAIRVASPHQVEVWRINTGSFQQIGSESTTTWVAGDILRLESDGSSHRILQNGSQVLAPQTDTLISGELSAGISAQNASAGTTIHDDWQAGDITAETTYEINTTLNGAIAVGRTASLSLDAILQRQAIAREVALNAAIARVGTENVSLDGVLQKAGTASLLLNAALEKAGTISTDLDAALALLGTENVNLNAVIQAQRQLTVAMDAVIWSGSAATVSLDAVLQAGRTLTVALDAALQTSGSQSVSLNAILATARSLTASLNAAIAHTGSVAVSMNGVITGGINAVSVSLEGALQKAMTVSASLSGAIQTSGSASVLLDAMLALSDTVVVSVDAVLAKTQALTVSLNGAVRGQKALTVSLSGVIGNIYSAPPRRTITVSARSGTIVVPARGRTITVH